MKISEELYLRKIILQIKKYAKDYDDPKSFFNNLDALDIKSLQDLSFNSDLKFFDDVNFILSVIISIVVHPHISTKGENIVLRSDQIGSVQNDMFLQTLRDSQLWKHNQEKEMIPEYVHYYQNVDEIRIYENIFICMLINLLNEELNKYSSFYQSMIVTYRGEDTLSMSDDNVFVAFSKIEILKKKIRRIKETNFYKMVSKGGVKLSHITPTNILLKDRLYNYCFKFYRKLISYEDKDSLIYDFTSYYYVLMLKALKDFEFKVSSSKKNSQQKMFDNDGLKMTNEISLMNNKFKITVSFNENLQTILLNVKSKELKDIEVKHELFIDPDSSFAYVEEVIRQHDDFENYMECLSIWNRAYIDNDKITPIKQNPMSETDLIAQYLNDKLKEIKGSKRIYSAYCPSCKSKGITLYDNGIRECNSCRSAYAFVNHNDKNDATIWFIKLKR